MRCDNCGEENDDRNKFCIRCGQPLIRKTYQEEAPKKKPRIWLWVGLALIALIILVVSCVFLATTLFGGKGSQLSGAIINQVNATALASGSINKPAVIVMTPQKCSIAFTTNKGWDYSYAADMYFMNADGSNVQRPTNIMIDFDYANPAWSPDGSRIAFNSEGEIYVMNADGSNEKRLTNSMANSDGRGFANDPAWSPDGSRIAFTTWVWGDASHEIFVMNADGSNMQYLTNNIFDDYSPAWSPDGSKIAFSSYRDVQDGVYQYGVYVMNADGSNVQRLTNNLYGDNQPAWSPDGRRIAFVSGRDGGYHEIYVMNADGSNAQRLTNNSFEDSSPDWSPDGRRIAFVSGSGREEGNDEIYVMNADGSNVQRLTNNLKDDYDPAWSPACK